MLNNERMDYMRDRNNWELIDKVRNPMVRWKVIALVLLIAGCFLAVAWVQTVDAADEVLDNLSGYDKPTRKITSMMLVIPCQDCQHEIKVLDELEDFWYIEVDEGTVAKTSPGVFVEVCQDVFILNRVGEGESPVYRVVRTYLCK